VPFGQQKNHKLEKLLADRPDKTELIEKNVLKPGCVHVSPRAAARV
jgi:hypothetical protein